MIFSKHSNGHKNKDGTTGQVTQIQIWESNMDFGKQVIYSTFFMSLNKTCLPNACFQRLSAPLVTYIHRLSTGPHIILRMYPEVSAPVPPLLVAVKIKKFHMCLS
jgi:hypothetical protein